MELDEAQYLSMKEELIEIKHSLQQLPRLIIALIFVLSGGEAANLAKQFGTDVNAQQVEQRNGIQQRKEQEEFN